jgi:hypothetical protein
MIEIDTESSMTFLGLEEQKEERQRERVKVGNYSHNKIKNW